jgi:hypothetical protein
VPPTGLIAIDAVAVNEKEVLIRTENLRVIFGFDI